MLERELGKSEQNETIGGQKTATHWTEDHQQIMEIGLDI